MLELVGLASASAGEEEEREMAGSEGSATRWEEV